MHQVDSWLQRLEKLLKRQIEVTVKATSESQLDERINEIDCLLIGPHLAYILNDIQEQMAEKK